MTTLKKAINSRRAARKAKDAEKARENAEQQFEELLSHVAPQTNVEDLTIVGRAAYDAGRGSFALGDLVDGIRKQMERGAKSDILKALKHGYQERKQEVENATAEKRQDAKQKHRDEKGKAALAPYGNFAESVADAWRELAERNKAAPKLFNFNGRLVRIVPDRVNGGHNIEALDLAGMKNVLHRHFEFESRDGDGDSAAPNDVAYDMLAERNNPLPTLLGVRRAPFFTRNASGQIIRVDRAGYDPASRYYYDPAPDLRIPTVALYPSNDDVAKAKALLFGDVFIDFPFNDENGSSDASKAHILALTLLPFLRDVIEGPTPIHLIVKPMERTGAGLLISNALRISAGTGGAAKAAPDSDEEWRKQITAACRSGDQTLWIDNIERLDSKPLAIASTEDEWHDRPLGVSDTYSGRLRFVWIASGINPVPSREIAFRCVPIRLATDIHPSERDASKFKHKFLDIWVRKNRSQLVWACLTLIQKWIASGAKEYGGKRTLPRYENWVAVMGGLLDAIGVSGFLENLDLVQKRAEQEGGEWAAAVTAWLESDKGQFNRWRTLGSDDPHGSLVYLFEDQSIDIGIRGFDEPAKYKSLGRKLTAKTDAIFSIAFNGAPMQVAIRRRENTRGRREYCLERVDSPSSVKSLRRGELLRVIQGGKAVATFATDAG